MSGQDAPICGHRYERPGGRQHGDRMVTCDRPRNHDGDHLESAIEVTWPPKPTDGLSMRYVAVKHSASYHEARANRWRARALIGWGLAVATIIALSVVMFG